MGTPIEKRIEQLCLLLDLGFLALGLLRCLGDLVSGLLNGIHNLVLSSGLVTEGNLYGAKFFTSRKLCTL